MLAYAGVCWQAVARAIFDGLDTDKSGDISLDELRAHMQREDPSASEQQVLTYADVC
jgi:Ca2+-binding EF-hand superfamily protein